ncbi:hypothetical protein MSG28_009813 [Choristoneura fumiferana]|uniref:Uncharacterized protein n=1 Tax=Choristoneura fumiferana TaxID=7141 RepID=A0ACC0JCL2_CHOFU|nr:hypothetical protein MSG28_009813 [Choristoneura fumiferana]
MTAKQPKSRQDYNNLNTKMSALPEGSRITFRHTKPNPLFSTWLQELFEEAVEKKSNFESVLKEALTSLSKYPLPLQSGAECAILKGFDKKICAYLDKRLEVYNYNKNLLTNDPSGSDTETYDLDLDSPQRNDSGLHCSPNYNPGHCNDSQSSSKTDLSTENQENVDLQNNLNNPEPSASKASNRKSKALKKEELIEKAQKHSEESFTRRKPDSFYTAWSNMTRLVTKGLRNVPDIQLELDRPGTSEMRESPMPEVSCLDVLVVEMPAGSFDVILLIDKCETSGPSKKNDPTVVQFNKYPDLKHEYRSLKVGDFMWVAQHKTKTDQEIVLPYVVERKRMDDLGASIKDGRFHEQKFRLRKSGLENVIYLVENYGGNKHVGLPIQSLMQALQNTRVQDNFKVHETDSLKNSARFLAIMTKRLTTEYKDKNLTGYSRESKGGELMTFSFVNSASRKTKPLTVTETFIKLLLQLKGVSVEKALAITECYKTPRSLIEAYEECDKKEGEFLLANLKYGDLNRNVGPTVSKSVYHLFSNTNLA